MKRIAPFTFALLAAVGFTLAACDKREDMPPTGAGPGTTTTPSPSPMPESSTGATGSMSTSPAMPPASAASQ